MPSPKIAFRVDASLEMGSGHVMRCLTLADALREAGAQCVFICREHSGNLIGLIVRRGHAAIGLANPPPSSTTAVAAHNESGQLAHESWLGVRWEQDARQTADALQGWCPEWLIVDHYGLDVRWEQYLAPRGHKLMIIDDLADRDHTCELLLDQNLVHGMHTRYERRVPGRCICLIGPKYALLRRGFSDLRPASLSRRKEPRLERLLVFMGGSDADNDVSRALGGVGLSRRQWRHVDVVVGQNYPGLRSLQSEIAGRPGITLHVQTPDMASLLAAADLSVTAGGSVTWEKCALGVPSLVVVQSENQRPIAQMLHQCGAQWTLGTADQLSAADYARSLDEIRIDDLGAMIRSASTICDGSGVDAVVKIMEGHV